MSETPSVASSHEDEERSLEAMGFKAKDFPDDVSGVSYAPFIKPIEVMLKNFQYCDTTIVIDGERFHCHFAVLKCYSEYLANLEQPDIDLSSIELPSDQVSSLAFSEIYEWMLVDAKPIKRTPFAEVFKATVFLKVEQLIQQLMEIVDDPSIIDERCALSIFLEARRANITALQSFMVRKISRIFLTFVASQEFLDCSFHEISELFKSNRVAINTELDMVFIAVRWLSHRWPHRKECVKPLVTHIKLEIIDSHQLVVIKDNPEELHEILQPIQRAVDNALKMQIEKRNRLARGDCGEDKASLSTRFYIDDPLWEETCAPKSADFHENYARFLKYLRRINACHWLKVNSRDETLKRIEHE